MSLKQLFVVSGETAIRSFCEAAIPGFLGKQLFVVSVKQLFLGFWGNSCSVIAKSIIMLALNVTA